MPPNRKVSIAELLEMQASGAEIKKEDRPLVIEGFQSLVKEMQRHLDLQREIAENHEKKLAQYVDKISTGLQTQHLDIEALAAAIADAVRPLPRPDYRFHVERDGNGQITEINAKNLTH